MPHTDKTNWPGAVASFCVGFGLGLTSKASDSITWLDVLWSVAFGLTSFGTYILNPKKESKDKE